jgi:glycosyltransferase involved in cell wall biosynthesis
VIATPQVSVVIPVFNEEGNVSQLQMELESALKEIPYEIVFVDDGSQDRTVERIRRGAKVRVLEFAKNSGQSAAICAGLANASGTILVLMDGDLQNDPRDIPCLVAEINKGFDLVCGYRVNRKDTWFKRVQSLIANKVRSRFTKDGIRDTGCTLKAMRQECREALIPFQGMHRFIPALIKGLGYRITEIPVNHRPRRSGVSKYNFGNRALRATTDMLGVRWLLGRQFQIRIKRADEGDSPKSPNAT